MTDRTQSSEGGYDVLAPLSSGTYGENLVAVRRDPLGLGKLFVLRQIRRSLCSDEKVRVAFVEMAKRAVRLSHPNVIQTYEIGERGGALFMVTEFVDGESLDGVHTAILPAPHAVDPRLWLLIACEALSGLHHAHELRDFDGTPVGLVHGGISPRRIFIGYSGRVVVTDFGLAMLARHAKRIEGTYLPEMVSYAAPEQRQGRACDRRVDVFSLGLVLWELLAGRRHRNPGNVDATLEKLPPLREVKDTVSPELSAIVAKATELDPAQRWQSALEFRRALEAHADLALLRRNALGDSMTALFQRTKDKIPSLLSRRVEKLLKQEPTAVALVPAAASTPPAASSARPVSSAPPISLPIDSEGEEEEAFLLGSPIEAISEDAVLSVRELVSTSELLSGDLGSESDVSPESAAPVSSVELIIPVDQGSGKSLDEAAFPTRESALPTMTQRSPGSEPPPAEVPATKDDTKDDEAPPTPKDSAKIAISGPVAKATSDADAPASEETTKTPPGNAPDPEPTS